MKHTTDERYESAENLEPVDPPRAHECPAPTLEQAAELLISKLSPALQNVCYETAYLQQRITLWAFIAGHLLRAYENGVIWHPVLDPSWSSEFGMRGVRPPVETPCEQCGVFYTPRRWKQRFCSSPCGIAAGTVPVTPEPVATSPNLVLNVRL